MMVNIPSKAVMPCCRLCSAISAIQFAPKLAAFMVRWAFSSTKSVRSFATVASLSWILSSCGADRDSLRPISNGCPTRPPETRVAPPISFPCLANGVLHIAGNVVGGTFRLVELAFALQFLIVRQLAGRVLDGSFDLVGRAFDVFPIHCWLLLFQC